MSERNVEVVKSLLEYDTLDDAQRAIASGA